ncbi:hypothetical protein ACCS45_04355 [Rhizobium ruizarguesonis]
MGRILNIAITVVVAGLQSGCGFGVAEVADIIDRSDLKARTHLELQIKQAIFCELKKGAFDARTENSVRRFHQQSEVTSPGDGPFPDTWGAQVSFNLTTDETSTLTPGVTLNYPRVPGVSNAGAVGRSFNFGFGGTLSTQNVNYDKYDFYWTAAQLTAGGEKCNPMPKELLGPKSRSSPFVNGAGLGVKEWLPGAVAVVDFRRSSRAAENGEGKALGPDTSDTATYSNKFVIVTSGNITPTWTLVRVTANNAALLDLNRTKTHELIITVGPGSFQLEKDKTGKSSVVSGPSQAALNAQLAAQIGSAVAAAIKGQ